MPSPTSKATRARKPKLQPAETVDHPPADGLAGLLDRERVASERGVAMLDQCIAEVEKMLDGGEYDTKLASHLAWILNMRSQSVAKLRQFGERVKVQSSELTPEQRLRAVAKYLQSLPQSVRDEFRALLDAPIDDIEIIG